MIEDDASLSWLGLEAYGKGNMGRMLVIQHAPLRVCKFRDQPWDRFSEWDS